MPWMEVPAFAWGNEFAESGYFILAREANTTYSFIAVDFARIFLFNKLFVYLLFYVGRAWDYLCRCIRHEWMVPRNQSPRASRRLNFGEFWEVICKALPASRAGYSFPIAGILSITPMALCRNFSSSQSTWDLILRLFWRNSLLKKNSVFLLAPLIVTAANGIGKDHWSTVAIERFSVPSIRVLPFMKLAKLQMSDGPNGVRGTKFFNCTPAACFPCGSALAATWDIDLMEKVGNLLGLEAKAKAAHVLLGPTCNIARYLF